MAKIVILGANGFIGRHLVKRLSQDRPGDAIIAFGHFTNYMIGGGHDFDNLPNVVVFPGDFSIKSSIEEAVTGADYVFHLISTTTPAISHNDPYVEIDINVRYSLEAMEACVAAKVKRFIFLSSGGTVYGDVDSDTIHEDILPHPRSPYGIGKLTIEHYLRYFKYNNQLDYIVYRVANPYGPGQNIHGKQGIIPIFLNSYLNKEPVNIYGDGMMIRDYIYIDDVVNMIAHTFDRKTKYSVYNIGSGTGATINDVVQAIEEHIGDSVDKIFQEVPAVFVRKSVLNISRFTDEFKITPFTTLLDGIGKTWSYVKSIP